MDGTFEGIVYTDRFFWHHRSSDLIGHGAFGKVRKGRNKETGEFVAVKTCDKQDDKQYCREIDILKQMDSPYIVKFIASEVQRVLIMELADGSVREELKKLENMFGLSYRILLKLIDHLGKGLLYLNSKMIAHRDVKPENILIFHKSDGMTFKLCDFGGSRFVTDNYQPLHSICGTPGYLNEYSTANLARKTTALSYTKDECDLWSVGCTLFECATGILPFVPAKGPADTAEMYNMMVSRPSDAIFGRTNDRGEFVWEKDFPEGRCSYPKSFRRVLGEFIRHLFDRREATRLTFSKFDEMCNELLSLKRISVFKMNTLLFEEYFDTSTVVHFERFYFDLYAKADMPTHDLTCLLTLPAGSALAYKSPPLPMNLIEQCCDIVIMGVQDGNYHMPKSLPEPIVHSSFGSCNRHPSLHEMKVAAANTLSLERQTHELQNIVPNFVHFLHEIYDKLLSESISLSHDLNFANILAEQMRLLSKAIAVNKETTEERKAVESNAHSVVRELAFIGEAVEFIRGKLQEIDKSIIAVESKPFVKMPSIKCEIEAVVKLRTCSPYNGSPENALLMETDRKYLLNSYEKTMRNYEENLKQLCDVYLRSMEMIFRDIFDITRKLHKTKKQLTESLQLIAITEQTNKCRLASVQSSTGGKIQNMSASFTHELPSLLRETKEHARRQKVNAANSLMLTEEWLRGLES